MSFKDSKPSLFYPQILRKRRFSYSPAFHDSVSITLWHRPIKGKEYEMESVIVSYQSQEGEKPTFEKNEKVVTEEQFKRFESLFNRITLVDRSFDEPPGGLDGSSWTLEGAKNGLSITHHRWSPIYREDHEFVEIGKSFFEFAEIEISSDELY